MKSMSPECFPDFCFVDTAVGGANRRNHVMLREAFKPEPWATDVYATVFRYTEELRCYAETNPHVAPDRLPSVARYAGPAYADRFFLDMDSESDLDFALRDARTAVAELIYVFGVPPWAINVCFSGNKGFAIEVDAEVFGGFVPDPAIHHHFKALALRLFPTLLSLDLGVYSPLRLWRVENTRHGTSGLWKVPLSIPELDNLTISEILRLARGPRDLPRLPAEEITPIAALQGYWNSARREVPPRTCQAELPILLVTRQLSGAQERQIIAAVREHVRPGNRHFIALGLAGVLARSGISSAQAREIVAELFGDDPELDDRLRSVDNSYFRLRSGNLVAGFPTLADHLPSHALAELGQVLPGSFGIRVVRREFNA